MMTRSKKTKNCTLCAALQFGNSSCAKPKGSSTGRSASLTTVWLVLVYVLMQARFSCLINHVWTVTSLDGYETLGLLTLNLNSASVIQ